MMKGDWERAFERSRGQSRESLSKALGMREARFQDAVGEGARPKEEPLSVFPEAPSVSSDSWENAFRGRQKPAPGSLAPEPSEAVAQPSEAVVPSGIPVPPTKPIKPARPQPPLPPPYSGTSQPAVMTLMRSSLENIWATILLHAPERPGNLLLCGSTPGEGVTFLSFHLALFLYLEYNLKVLYVDTDPGGKRYYLQGSNPMSLPGLGAYFNQGRPPDSLILKTEFPGFFILPGGDLGNMAKTGTMIGEKKSLEALMEYTATHFHVAVFDGTPVLRSPGILGLAKAVDQVVLVCRYGVSSREVSSLALEKLREVQAPVLGIILNDRQYPIPPRIYKILK